MFSEESLQRTRSLLSPIAILIICGAQLLDVLSVTGLIFSTNEIVLKYNVTVQTASWVLSSYTLTYGSFILLGGKLGDYVGHRSIFMIGMSIFALSALICAAVENVYVLFVFRAVQGIGAALTIPTSFGMIAHNFEGRRQAIAFAIVGSIAAIGGIVGILVGGGFAETSIGYRGLMYLAFGLSAAFAFSIFFTVEETLVERHKISQLDYPGAFIVVSGMILVVFGFTSAPGNWNHAKFIAPLIIGLALIVVFGFYETYFAEQYFKVEPLIPHYVWKFRNLKPIAVMSPLNFSTLYVIMFVGTIQLMDLRGKSSIGAAVDFIAMGVAFGLACVVGGASFGRFSPRWFLTISPILLVISAVLMTRVNETNSYWQYYFPAMVLSGVGSALYMSTFVNTIANATPLNLQGLTSGICICAGQLGTAIAFAISTSELGNGSDLKNYQNVYYTILAYGGVSTIVSILFTKDLENKEIGQQSQKYEDKDKPVLPVVEDKNEEIKTPTGSIANTVHSEDDA